MDPCGFVDKIAERHLSDIGLMLKTDNTEYVSTFKNASEHICGKDAIKTASRLLDLSSMSGMGVGRRFEEETIWPTKSSSNSDLSLLPPRVSGIA